MDGCICRSTGSCRIDHGRISTRQHLITHCKRTQHHRRYSVTDDVCYGIRGHFLKLAHQHCHQKDRPPLDCSFVFAATGNFQLACRVYAQFFRSYAGKNIFRDCRRRILGFINFDSDEACYGKICSKGAQYYFQRCLLPLCFQVRSQVIWMDLSVGEIFFSWFRSSE